MSADFFSSGVLGHLQLGLDLDQLLGHRGVGEVLLGQLAQVGVQVLHELRPVVLGGGHALEQLLLLLGEVLDRLLGQVLRGLDDLLLLLEELVELVLASPRASAWCRRAGCRRAASSSRPARRPAACRATSSSFRSTSMIRSWTAVRPGTGLAKPSTASSFTSSSHRRTAWSMSPKASWLSTRLIVRRSSLPSLPMRRPGPTAVFWISTCCVRTSPAAAGLARPVRRS